MNNALKQMLLTFGIMLVYAFLAYSVSCALNEPVDKIVSWFAIGAVSSIYSDKLLNCTA